jgi:hypothetical protein
MTKLASEPKLAKPGAGLPFFEWAMAKYLLFPRLFTTLTSADAKNMFAEESKKIVALVSPLDAAMLSERRLIPRLPGLEDSSRYWSIAMTLQHLVIVGKGMGKIITDLSGGSTNVPKVGTADVKPDASVNPETILKNFQSMSEHFLTNVDIAKVNNFPKATHPHPWFAELNAHQWLVVAGRHQNIHRKQIKGIIERF